MATKRSINTTWLCTVVLWAAFQQPTFAQTTVPTGPLPTDLTPIRLPEERELFRPGPTFYAFQKLPSRLWFNINAETNQRFESNVLLTKDQPKRDYVYRVFPNVTVGYNLTKTTSIYTNYFVIKDVYAGNYTRLTLPTTQSLSMGIRRAKQLGAKTSLQFDLQARELWQEKNVHQFDYIAGALVTRRLTAKMTGFANLQLQMRGGHAFVAPTRELDPFYTLGVFRQFGKYTMSVTDTFITNFRDPTFSNSIPAHGNVEMIADIEVYRPISQKYRGLVAFIRAEPIFNWRSAGTPSISGFDFRLYSGIRLQVFKPSVGSMVDQMKKEILKKRNESDAAPSSNEDTPVIPSPVPSPFLQPNVTPVPSTPIIPNS